MTKRLTAEAATWVEEAVAVHEAVCSRLRAAQGRGDGGNVAIELKGPLVEAAATITAAIITRAGSTGPYDLLEDDPEATAREEERQRARDQAIHPS